MVECDEEGLVAETGSDVFHPFTDLVRDSAEDEYLFVLLIVSDHAHAMVPHVVDPVTVHGVLDMEPHLLVEQEQDEVVQEWSHIFRTHGIVAT